MKEYFKVLRFLDSKEINRILKKSFESYHYKKERNYRFYCKNPHNSFIGALVDKQHPNGNEFHILLSDLSLIVINESSFKICTILYPRPGQVERISKTKLDENLRRKIYEDNYLTKKYKR